MMHLSKAPRSTEVRNPILFNTAPQMCLTTSSLFVSPEDIYTILKNIF